MKQIVKGPLPEFFSQFIAQKQPKVWDDISPIRQDLREQILKAQGDCCAYTEVRLNGADDCHIDHYHTRNLFPQKTFEYENLLVSCNAEEYAAKYKDKQLKSKSDYDELINPVNDRPSDYIEFLSWGEVAPLKDSKKGKNTIDVFNLNEETLLERRKTTVSYIDSMIRYLSEDELVEAIGEFETMVRQLCRDYTL